MKTTNNIPKVIREARIKKSLTQLEVGVQCGYAGNSAMVTVARWEAGSRPIPTKNIRTVAKTLGLEISDLVP